MNVDENINKLLLVSKVIKRSKQGGLRRHYMMIIKMKDLIICEMLANFSI